MSSSEDEAPEQVSRSASRAQNNVQRKQQRAFQDAERAVKVARTQKRTAPRDEVDEPAKKRAKVAHEKEDSEEDDDEEDDDEGAVDEEALARMERAMQDAEDNDSDLDNPDNDEEASSDSEEELSQDDAGSSNDNTDADLDLEDEVDLPLGSSKYLPDHLFQSALTSSKPLGLHSTGAKVTQAMRRRQKQRNRRRQRTDGSATGTDGRKIMVLPSGAQSNRAAARMTVLNADANQFARKSLQLKAGTRKRDWERKLGDLGRSRARGVPATHCISHRAINTTSPFDLDLVYLPLSQRSFSVGTGVIQCKIRAGPRSSQGNRAGTERRSARFGTEDPRGRQGSYYIGHKQPLIGGGVARHHLPHTLPLAAARDRYSILCPKSRANAGPRYNTEMALWNFLCDMRDGKVVLPIVSKASKVGTSHIKRPRNSFIIFRSAFCEISEKGGTQQNISRGAGLLWNGFSEASRVHKLCTELAIREAEEHRRNNPNYKYTPLRPQTTPPTNSKGRHAKSNTALSSLKKGPFARKSASEASGEDESEEDEWRPPPRSRRGAVRPPVLGFPIPPLPRMETTEYIGSEWSSPASSTLPELSSGLSTSSSPPSSWNLSPHSPAISFAPSTAPSPTCSLVASAHPATPPMFAGPLYLPDPLQVQIQSTHEVDVDALLDPGAAFDLAADFYENSSAGLIADLVNELEHYPPPADNGGVSFDLDLFNNVMAASVPSNMHQLLPPADIGAVQLAMPSDMLMREPGHQFVDIFVPPTQAVFGYSATNAFPTISHLPPPPSSADQDDDIDFDEYLLPEPET
ncbi:hypothetical protein BKA62DRAFT_673285 [Auriculariales sp. MPI-PUGE-AT-0066]|nr:hypothetical protein BKA62DRAFT_673285 [Auriculariales sp. MPI-PUGE-AT-0066]